MTEKKRTKQKKSEFYQLKNEKIERTKKTCPKCGPGIFMAEHNDRYYCGKCSYTEWKNKKQ